MIYYSLGKFNGSAVGFKFQYTSNCSVAVISQTSKFKLICLSADVDPSEIC